MNTRLKVATALKKPKASHLVVSGGTVRDDPQDVTVNGLVVKPGAPSIPWSVRQITIYGGRDLKGVTVTRAPRVK